ncbi:MAG: S8 family serine peptidase, partial [Gammaproteobacteria bacterium]
MTTPIKTHRHPLAQWIALCAVALLLPGCGGGGGGGGSSSQPPPVVPVVPADPPAPTDGFIPRMLPMPPPFDGLAFEQKKLTFEDEEYEPTFKSSVFRLGLLNIRSDNHLRLINASTAYARGATGKGTLVGVVDSGIYPEHIEFGSADYAGRPFYEGVCQRETDPDNPSQKKICENYDHFEEEARRHGTAVASLITGGRGSPRGDRGRINNMQGVAYESDLIFHAVWLGGLGYVGWPPGNLSEWTEEIDRYMAENYYNPRLKISIFNSNTPAIVNHSFAWAYGDIDLYSADEVREKLKHTVAIMAQKDVPDADKIIIVRGAGNDGSAYSTSPALTSGLGVHFPELRSHVLAVVAVDQDGVLSNFSNPCGSAKDFCLAAPGSNLIAAAVNDDRYPGRPMYRRFSGTSAAAPIISGSLALLRQFFGEQVGNTELVTRILATANRDGIYADSDKYGHGLVDLDAATAPVGALMTSLSGDPLARPFTGGGFAQSGGAFGAAMQNALADVEIAAFDQLDAPFFFPVTGGAAPRVSAAYDMNLREHEIALGGGVSQSASLSLMTDDGELSSARIRRGNWWFSYGHHGGREAGLYLSGGGGIGGNGGGIGAGGFGAGGFGAGGALIGGIGMGGGIGA